MKQLLFILLIFSSVVNAAGPVHLIARKDYRVWNLTGYKYPERNFDGDTTTYLNYPPSINDQFATPMVFEVAFDSTYRGIVINYFHTTGASNWTVTLYDQSRTQRAVFTFQGVYNSWATVPVGTSLVLFPVRFIEFKHATPASGVMELRMYGAAEGIAPKILPAMKARPPDPGKYYQGMNVLYPNLDNDDAAWSLRLGQGFEYYDSVYYNPPDQFNHKYVFNKFENTDQLIIDPTRASGRKLHIYVAGASAPFQYSYGNTDSKDIPKGSDSTYIGNWINIRRFSKAIIDSFHLEEWEPGNEDVATWAGTRRWHSPKVLLQKVRSAKWGALTSSNPSAKIIFPAMTSIDMALNYLPSVFYHNYLEKGTSDSLPFDVISINHYSTTGGGQYSGPTVGISPEQDDVFGKYTELLLMRDTLFTGMLVYIEEFGWDRLNSNYSVPDIPGVDRETTQACWLIRNYDIGAAAGIDRAYMYTERDIGGGDFGTTGIEFTQQVGGVWGTYLKRAGYYLKTRAKLITNYSQRGIVIANGGSAGVWCIRYDHLTNPDSSLYAVWKGTSNNSTQSYKINTGTLVGNAAKTRLENLKPSGVSSSVTAPGGIISMIATEQTVYYRVKRKTAVKKIFTVISIGSIYSIIVYDDKTFEIKSN